MPRTASGPSSETPSFSPPGWGLKAALLIAIAAVILMVGLLKIAIEKRDHVIINLASSLQQSRTDIGRLESENAQLAMQMETLLQEIGTLNARLDDSYTPRDIGGMVDFPVQRGMARRGDTLESFARREGTTVATVRELNDWLPDDTSALKLADRQMLWIPKASR